MPWTDATTDLDGGYANGGCWADDLAEFIAAGQDAAVTEALISSADGINWIYRASPFDGGVGNAVARSFYLGLSVAVGQSPNRADAIITSPDDSAWTGAGNPFLSGGSGYGAAVRASDGAILLAGEQFGSAIPVPFAITTDDTNSWTLAAPWTSPPPFGTGYDGRAVTVRASDDLILIVAASNGSASNEIAAISSDGGATWMIATPFIGFGICCAIRQSDGTLIVGGIDISNRPIIAVSTDSGATWTTHMPFGVTTGEVAALAVRESDGALIAGLIPFAGVTATLAVSLTSGTTWVTHSPFGAITNRVSGIAVRASDDAILVTGASASKNFAISTTAGVTWTTQLVGFTMNAVAVRASDDLILITGRSTAVSADGGATWTLTDPFPSGNGLGCAVRASDDLLVVTGFDSVGLVQVGISSDSGATWSATVPDPFEAPLGVGQCVASKESTGALVVGSSSTGTRVIATSADGTTFTAVDSPFYQVGGVDYSPGEDLWIATGTDSGWNPVVAFSTDDGATWTVISAHPMTGFVPRVYRDEANDQWWLLGQTTGGHALAVSSDGGATWTEVATPLDPVAGDGGAYAMVNADGVLALGGVDATATNQMCFSEDDGVTWSLDADASPFGTALPATCYALAYSPPLSLAVAFGAG